MNQSIEERNKTLVLDAFEILFNKRDYAAAERYWSPKYVQTAPIFRRDEKVFSIWLRIHRRR